MKETLNIIKNDPWLEPFADAITGRHQYALNKEAELTNKGKQTLSDFASGYLYWSAPYSQRMDVPRMGTECYSYLYGRYIQQLGRESCL